jgi:hypothetical protein
MIPAVMILLMLVAGVGVLVTVHTVVGIALLVAAVLSVAINWGTRNRGQDEVL